MSFIPRLVRDDDEAPVVVHASPGLLMQLARLCFSLVSLVLLIASSLLGFLQDALYQAGAAAGRLGGQDVS
jgi:hypothetical protein